MYSSFTIRLSPFFFFFLFIPTATAEIYTLSLHDALPISSAAIGVAAAAVSQLELTRWVSYKLRGSGGAAGVLENPGGSSGARSEEHTSELQSQFHLVCRLLLEKKK